MSVLTSVIKFFGGSKSARDTKEVMPYVDKILEIYPTLEPLSNDELRARSEAMRAAIAKHIEKEENRIAELKSQIDSSEISIDDKEKMAKEVEDLTKKIDEKIEEKLDELLPEAFAVMKDTARRFKENETIEVTASDFDRNLATHKDFVTIQGDKAIYKNSWTAGGNTVTWDMVHYDVQLFGGVVLHKGKIAEMATGEGKTLVATLPVFLNALAGKGVHMVTVNDYLARRDSEWMGPMYEFHGLSVDCIDKHKPNSPERRKAYMADITFGTNNEYGFDYLRDNMSIMPDDLVQRKHHYAIVDEVDSVLIDDARTPLIISGPVPKGDDQMFEQYKDPIEELYKLQKAKVTDILALCRKLLAMEGDEPVTLSMFDEKKGELALLTEGDKEIIAKGKITMLDSRTKLMPVEVKNTPRNFAGRLLYRAYKGYPKYKPLVKFLSETGVKVLLQESEGAYLANKEEKMPEIAEGLYFMVDEKMHSADLTDRGHERLARTFKEDDFFVLPDIGSELADLEKSEVSAEEKAEQKSKLVSEYSIKSERLHTVNQLLKAYSMFEEGTEYVVMDGKVKIVDEQTGRILEGRRYSDGLHQAIEAKESKNNVKIEAATQTFATITLQNYFRMYHKLAGMTGTAETEAAEFWNIYKLDVVTIPTNRPIIRDDRDDLIYRTENEKYKAVIVEIEKVVAEGRPVLVGTTSVEISERLSRMLNLRGVKHSVLNAKLHQQEAQIVAEAGRAGQVTIATNMAGRGTDIKLSPEVKEAGGLAIIGTERHDSRRVDRQLRGRAGRQGDPGSSQFFVSLEDSLMRLFGSERIAGMMDRMGLEEGEVIQAKMMSNAIERAQKKVEENNYGIRKRLLEYDDVMNAQRQAIYTRRKNALFGERIELDLNDIMYDFAEDFVENYSDSEFEDLSFELIRLVAVHPSFDEETFRKANKDDLVELIVADLRTAYESRAMAAASVANPIIQKVYKEQGAQYENIRIPITNGVLGYNVSVDLKKAAETDSAEVYKMFSKLVMLTTIDDNWREHLREMDDLRQSVQNATYEQKDPLLIYKFESYGLFSKMISKVNREVLAIINKSYIPVRTGAEDPSQLQQQRERAKVDVNRLHASRMEAARQAGAGDKGRPMPVQVEKKVGRNEPCPCGSGKKYKQCHGKES